MTYGHRRPPLGNQARVSTDHGRTWSEPIVLSATAGGDLGYPSTVELADGTLLSVWYEVSQGTKNAGLRQARWRLKAASLARLPCRPWSGPGLGHASTSR